MSESAQAAAGDRVIPLVDSERDNAPAQELALARAASIQAYANVEQSLAGVFATLLGTDREIAGAIFFRIVNAGTRMAILEDVLRKRHGQTFDTFWKSLAKSLQSISSRRNEVVHWHVVHNLRSDGDNVTSTFSLSPPTFWSNPTGLKSIGVSDLQAFSSRCDFVSRLMNMWLLLLAGHLRDDTETLWSGIFQQAIVYPPPDDHPLSRSEQ